ncbi:hypothetical protein E3N88_34241 [Mikania micrantha]|uniref:Uncharacterized protein n=1 Tax=Mikania micrantha TaxID=192012 RepID=A0A5N6LXU9_9ASTR|nr:hypothetical protein E3N88_34241 [Mikania micrantha]
MAARRISSVVSRSLFLRPLSSSISPRGEVIANVAEGDAEDIDCTVFAARKAFDEGPWPKVTAYNRPVDYVLPVEEVLYMYEPVNFGLAVEVSCIYTSLSTSGRQLRCLVLHKPVDFGSTVEAKFSVQYD